MERSPASDLLEQAKLDPLLAQRLLYSESLALYLL